MSNSFRRANHIWPYVFGYRLQSKMPFRAKLKNRDADFLPTTMREDNYKASQQSGIFCLCVPGMKQVL
jgi:hypothetical protein